MFRIGIIGYGGRMSGVVDRIVETGKAMPVAIADPDVEGAKSRAAERNFTDITYYTNAEDMLRSEKLDGICIGTRCSLHTKLALLAAQYGVPVFLEKPVSITEEELDQLRTLEDRYGDFLISFPLRFTRIVEVVKNIIDSGRIRIVSLYQMIASFSSHNSTTVIIE